MDETYKPVFRVCIIWDAQVFWLINYCGVNIEPFRSDVYGDHRRPKTLVEICRNIGICCGFRAVAARGKYPGFILLPINRGGFPSQRSSNAENVSIWWRHHGCGALVIILCYPEYIRLNKIRCLLDRNLFRPTSSNLLMTFWNARFLMKIFVFWFLDLQSRFCTNGSTSTLVQVRACRLLCAIVDKGLWHHIVCRHKPTVSERVFLAFMITSSDRNISRVTGHLWGESTGHRWIPLTKASDGAFMFSLICAWTNSWAITRDSGDLRRHRPHYDVTVMRIWKCWQKVLIERNHSGSN